MNVNYDTTPDQFQLDNTVLPFNFIRLAKSGTSTVVKIDTNTGVVLGEYRSAPDGYSGNPSRTTVDADGSVWVANRSNIGAGGYGTVVHIGLEENNQCEDRNLNGVIETSTGLGDVKVWQDNNPAGSGGVAFAHDECIVHYTVVNSQGTRHVSVDANNDVWVSGTIGKRKFDLVKGGKYDVPASRRIVRSETAVRYGGYGGLIDPSGVVCSARLLLRWDTANALTGPNGDPDPGGLSIGPPAAGTNWTGQSGDSYGLCIDSMGNVWNTQLLGNRIHKFAPDGSHLGAFQHGNYYGQGCVVDGTTDHVWIAHSIAGPQNTVGHIDNDGTLIVNVVVGSGPTGVAVDGNGKIWSSNYNSHSTSRIDPDLGSAGTVDLTVDLGVGALPCKFFV